MIGERPRRAVSVILLTALVATQLGQARAKAQDLPQFMRGVQMAGALGVSHVFLRDKLLPQGKGIAPAHVLEPLQNIVTVADTLEKCDRADWADAVGRKLVSGVSVRDCENARVELSRALVSLQQNTQKIVGTLSSDEEESLIQLFYDKVIQKTRQNTLNLYAAVKSRYSAELPSESEDFLRQVYVAVPFDSVKTRAKVLSDVISDRGLSESLAPILSNQPEDDLVREYNRDRLFDLTREAYEKIAHEREATTRYRLASEAAWEFRSGRWVHEAPKPGRERVGDSTFSLRTDLQSSFTDFNPVRDAMGFLDSSRLRLSLVRESPALRIVDPPKIHTGSTVPDVIRARYAVEIPEWKDRARAPITSHEQQISALSWDLDRLAPGQGSLLAAQILNEMDKVFPKKGNHRISATQARELTDRIFEQIQIQNSEGRPTRLLDYGRENFAFHRSELIATQANQRQNVLNWQSEAAARFVESGVSDASFIKNSQLQNALDSFYQNSLQLLKAIDEEMANDDPRSGLKSAIARNPAVIAEVLAENPWLASIACKLANEVISDAESEKKWDVIWAVAGITAMVGVLLLTGGLAIAGAGMTAALLAGGGSGLLLGGVGIGRNLARASELNSEGEKARLYLHGLGVGSQEEIDALFERAHEQMVQAAVTGALLPLDAIGVFKGIRSLSGARALAELREVAQGGGSLIGIAKKYNQSEGASGWLAHKDILWSLKRTDLDRLKAAEKVLGRKLSDQEKVAVLIAHEVGAEQAGKDGTRAMLSNYTEDQIAEKARILADVKKPDGTRALSVEQTRLLIEKGVVGQAPIQRSVEQIAKDAQAFDDLAKDADLGDLFSFRSAESGSSYEGIKVIEVVRDPEGKVIRLIGTDVNGRMIVAMAERADPKSLVIQRASQEARRAAREALESLDSGTPPVKVSDFSAADQAAALKFIDMLPPPAELKAVSQVSAHPISDRSILFLGVTEKIAVIKDKDIDPVLVNWLEKTTLATAQITDPLSRARALQKEVEKTFSGGWFGFLNPLQSKRYREMTRDDTVQLLGKFIQNRQGVCRHQAPALQLALQEAGIQSTLKVGRVKQYVKLRGIEKQVSDEMHAWVEITHPDGKIEILDPTMRVSGLWAVGDDVGHRQVTVLKGPSKGRLSYEPITGSVISGGTRPLNQVDIEDLIEGMR